MAINNQHSTALTTNVVPTSNSSSSVGVVGGLQNTQSTLKATHHQIMQQLQQQHHQQQQQQQQQQQHQRQLQHQHSIAVVGSAHSHSHSYNMSASRQLTHQHSHPPLQHNIVNTNTNITATTTTAAHHHLHQHAHQHQHHQHQHPHHPPLQHHMSLNAGNISTSIATSSSSTSASAASSAVTHRHCPSSGVLNNTSNIVNTLASSSVKVSSHTHHGATRHHLTPQHRSLSQQHAAATLRRRTLSHVPRSYSASAATSAGSSGDHNTSTLTSSMRVSGNKGGSGGGGNVGHNVVVVERSRCRSPMMLCHSHSDGEFPMYKDSSERQQKRLKNISLPRQYSIKSFNKTYQQFKDLENPSSSSAGLAGGGGGVAGVSGVNKKYHLFVAAKPSILEAPAVYSPYLHHHSPLLASSSYAAASLGTAYAGGFVSPLYGTHLSHVTPYVAAAPYVGHYGLHPYESLLLRR
ncbi:uncharacterized protein ACRADG_002064 [Cochliomyia hominivorax]